MLEQAGLAVSDLDAVYTAGGSSRIPLVATVIEARFGRRPRAARDPELAVTNGAAAWAALARYRAAAATAPDSGSQPLRWEIPGQVGTLVDWPVAEGQAFNAGDTLARVRLPDGDLVLLTASTPGVLRGQHARRGDRVESGYWLATVDSQSIWLSRSDFDTYMLRKPYRFQPGHHDLYLVRYTGCIYLLRAGISSGTRFDLATGLRTGCTAQWDSQFIRIMLNPTQWAVFHRITGIYLRWESA
jgi:hypothetical protein